LLKGGRVQIGILWGHDLIVRGPIYWSRRVTAWPSIGVCGMCALELADWLAVAPPARPDDGEAKVKPAPAAKSGRARAPRKREGAGWVV
jgi:hypothetical protein